MKKLNDGNPVVQPRPFDPFRAPPVVATAIGTNPLGYVRVRGDLFAGMGELVTDEYKPPKGMR